MSARPMKLWLSPKRPWIWLRRLFGEFCRKGQEQDRIRADDLLRQKGEKRSTRYYPTDKLKDILKNA
jgi:hypothetical protein